MAYPFKFSNQTMLDAVDKGLAAAGYGVEKLGRKTAIIKKGDQVLKVAIRTSRNRWIGSGSSGALHRSDIDALVVGAVNSVENPASVQVYLIPRTEILRRWEARRAARKGAGYTVGLGPSFIALDKLEGNEGFGSGLAEESKPIGEIKIAEFSADQPSTAADIQVVDTGLDGIDRFKQEVIDSAAKWLRFDPARVKIDIHITVDA